METIRGKTSLDLDLTELTTRLANYNRVLLDLGTGDGRYVRTLAGQHRDWFVIGVDSCRENLREHSRASLANMLFIIASAQDLPCELNGLVSYITINFPWGSLLGSLLNNDPSLLNGLSSITQKSAHISISLNGGALAEAGTSLDEGSAVIHENLNHHAWNLRSPKLLDARELKSFPTTWAKRLVHGRDPRAMRFSGIRSM